LDDEKAEEIAVEGSVKYLPQIVEDDTLAKGIEDG
jgi:hypothetical protein